MPLYEAAWISFPFKNLFYFMKISSSILEDFLCFKQHRILWINKKYTTVGFVNSNLNSSTAYNYFCIALTTVVLLLSYLQYFEDKGTICAFWLLATTTKKQKKQVLFVFLYTWTNLKKEEQKHLHLLSTFKQTWNP